MSLEEEIHSLTIVIEKLHDLILEGHDLILEGRGGLAILDDLFPKEEDLDKIAESLEESPIPVEVQGTDSKTMELINLSKRMGYPYLMQDGKLIVDNEVLNTYSRQGRNPNEV